MSWRDILGDSANDNDISEMYRRAVEFIKPGDCIVQVGVGFGRSLACLAEHCLRQNKRVMVVGVDTWLNPPEEAGRLVREAGGYKEACVLEMQLKASESYWNVHLVEKSSLSAAKSLSIDKPIGFVFFESIDRLTDISEWAHRLKPGGMIGGVGSDDNPIVRNVLYGASNVFRVGNCWSFTC